MTQQFTERLNQRDHWPPGICNPPGTGMCNQFIIRPPGLVRNLVTHPQTGDPSINFIL